MEILRRSTPVFIVILVVCWNSRNVRCHTNHWNFDLITRTIYNDIEFMYDRPQQMNVDAILGVALTEVHATAVLEDKNVNNLSDENRRVLEEIVKLCEAIRFNGRDVVTVTGLNRMIRPETWNRRILWTRGAFGKKPVVSSGLTSAKAVSLMFEGSPTAAESNECFRELVKERESPGCYVSKQCEEMILRNDTTYRGYPLTHRLIYVQLSLAFGCAEGFTGLFENLKRKYCAAILQDLVDLEATNFPANSRDLVMEQIVVCGMEGYLEFVSSHYADLIISWVNPHGCYSAFGFGGRNNRRKKRTTSLMDYGCDNHASGLGAASLSLLIRAAVENCVNSSV